MRSNKHRQQRDVACSAAELELVKLLEEEVDRWDLTYVEVLKVLASLQTRTLSYAYRDETAPDSAAGRED